MLVYNDMPREDDEAGQLTIEQLQIAFNWQFAIASSKSNKLTNVLRMLNLDWDIEGDQDEIRRLSDFLNSLDCQDIDIDIGNCQ